MAQLRGFRLGRKEILDEEEDLLSLLEPDLVRPELREAGFVSEAAASSLFFRPRERFGAFFLFRTSLSFLKEQTASENKKNLKIFSNWKLVLKSIQIIFYCTVYNIK